MGYDKDSVLHDDWGCGFSSYNISFARCDSCPSTQTLKSAGLAWACLITSKLGHTVLLHEKNTKQVREFQCISYNLFMEDI